MGQPTLEQLEQRQQRLREQLKTVTAQIAEAKKHSFAKLAKGYARALQASGLDLPDPASLVKAIAASKKPRRPRRPKG